MTEIKTLTAGAAQAEAGLLVPALQTLTTRSAAGCAAVLVPIRSLGDNHRARIGVHLMALDARDRYLRFGFYASDEQIGRYVEGLNFERDDIFGIYNRHLVLIAMAHLAFSSDNPSVTSAEFGVSVLKSARGRGYGERLFDRAVMHARNAGVDQMLIHALSENQVMLGIARKAGAVVERDGSESEAHLRLQPATLDSRLTELFEEQVARTDYSIKSRVKQFKDLLDGVQTLRRKAPSERQNPPT